MSSIIDQSDCKIFCRNCNRTVSTNASGLDRLLVPTITENFCFHLLDYSGKLVSINSSYNAILGKKQFLERGTNHQYKIVRCDGKKNE